MDLTDSQLERYARHILLPEVGGLGQARLLSAKVLVIGAGGLGSPVILYLAAAGVGTIGVIDADRVDLSNLQRQVLHDAADVGRLKVQSARDAVIRLNPDVRVIGIDQRLTAANARDLIAGYDLVCDGCDNFDTRLAVNDACVALGIPLVSAAVTRFDGQLGVFDSKSGGPCYRCLVPEAPPRDDAPTCAEVGVLGSVTGILGTLQATEALKLLLDIGEPLRGRLLLIDALSMAIRTVRLPKDPECRVCGAAGRVPSEAA